MTDGRNTVGIGEEEWVQRDGTQNWRRFVTGRPSPIGLTGERPGDDPTSSTTQTAPEICTPNTVTIWYQICNNSDTEGNNWQTFHGPASSDPGPYSDTYTQTRGNRRNRRTVTVTRNCHSESFDQTTQVCTPPQFETTWSGYEYFEGETPPAGNWEEGEPDITSNIETRAQCDSLHQDGVDVFTIAFALAEGSYLTNDWGDLSSANPSVFPTTADNENDARAILQYCASKPENFITADNTEALEEAFERIGNTIVKEIIRIDS